MPTKKPRVGFIPRKNVLALINKLSFESNLSHSKIVNILVEEALHERGLFNSITGEVCNENSNKGNLLYNKDTEIVKNKVEFNFAKKIFNDENPNFKEIETEQLDDEIYDKFLMFLQFQERMKRRD